MKWEVCSSSTAGGTEVLGTVSADNESDAAQRANEKFRPCWDGEDIIVRPFREVPKERLIAEGRGHTMIENYSDAPQVKEFKEEPKDKSVTSLIFNVDAVTMSNGSLVKDSMTLCLDADTAFRLVQEILAQGLGKQNDEFTIELVGKIELMPEF